MIEFRTLGVVDLREADGTEPQGHPLPGIPGQPKRLALLAYLAMNRPVGPVLRDSVLAVFWPESSTSQARNALNQSVYALRRSLGAGTVRTHGVDALSIDPERLWCDAVAFQTAFEGGEAARALELYRGPLLPGLHVSGCPAFERWLSEERRICHRRATEAAALLADRARGEGNLVGAARWLERATGLEPHDESLVRRHVDLLLELGDRPGALRAYQRFHAALEELDLPSPDASGRWLAAIRDGGRSSPHRPVARAPEPGDPGDASTVARPSPSNGDAEGDGDDGHPTRLAAAVAGSARPEARAGRSRRRSPVVVGLIAIAALGGMWVAAMGEDRERATPTPAESEESSPRRVLVSTFYQGPGVSSPVGLGGLVAEWIALELTRTGLVQAVPEPLVTGDGWNGAGSASPLLSNEARTLPIARRVGADLVVRGSVVRSGNRVVVEAALIDAATGTVLRGVEPVLAPADDPWHAVEVLRDRVSGALATVVDPRLRGWAAASSQPPSFDAYGLYAAGLDDFQALDFEGAREHFLAAARTDSSFTSPIVWAMQLPSLGFDEVDRMGRPLEERRAELAPWDRLMLDARLAEVRGDRSAAYASMRALAELVPRSYWWTRTAELALELNAPDSALAHLERAEPFGPHPVATAGLGRLRAEALHRLGRYAEERDGVARWADRAPEQARWVELRALAGMGRTKEVEARVSAMFVRREWRRSIADHARTIASELRAHGDTAAARRLLRRLLDWYETAPDSIWDRPEQYIPYARTLAAAGREGEARRVFARLLEEGVLSEVVRGDLGILAARSGDHDEAERMAAWFAEASDHWAPHGGGWYKQWEARIAATLGDRERAVALLRESYARGWAHLLEDHRQADWDALRGYPPFEELTAVR